MDDNFKVINPSIEELTQEYKRLRELYLQYKQAGAPISIIWRRMKDLEDEINRIKTFECNFPKDDTCWTSMADYNSNLNKPINQNFISKIEEKSKISVKPIEYSEIDVSDILNIHIKIKEIKPKIRLNF